MRIGCRNNQPFNSWDALKLLGLALALLDHSALFLLSDVSLEPYMRAAGRGAMPVFLFLTGYARSYRFSCELLILAAMLSLSDIVVTHQLYTQNVLYTILLSRVALRLLASRDQGIGSPYGWYGVSLCWIVSAAVVDYGSIGFSFALAGHVCRERERYGAALSQRFLLLCFTGYFAYCCLQGFLALPTAASLGIIYVLLLRFRVRTIALIAPPRLASLALILARYSAYVFAGQLLLLQWVTGVPLAGAWHP